MITESVYIGLGANLNDPVAQLKSALKSLQSLPDTQLVSHSSLYSSKPLGPQEQPEYVNAVAELRTELAPLSLLDALQVIEQEQGRVRKEERWGPRTLDLDIILFGKQIISCERLTVPHYHFHAREFVLYPLNQIAPALRLPDGTPLATLISQVPDNGLTELIPACDLGIA
ncbi:2-amino-4-hydroxy-6-hydroxymethyldihydropteridine diphosphokinase [Planctobacterium marinum]|uniref:2-amino-4-hydroxy-6-hydroxymethyldihydropteridine pyrophosphokinase n=1 Tax=Planctobacterium marinum TaxID=1631968 RepID=A0AA48HCX4_9ALTE|nr:2-amino-4-hydroxy-6-hydroxymethyldihydropteridine diphosphokinase [Planctobacterium marinum]